MKNRLSWFGAGVLLAVLNLIVFARVVTNRPIGASTTYPYLADLLAGLKNSAYFLKIQTPGHWEMIFLLGAFLAGLVASLAFGDFKLTSIHERWKKHKGDSSAVRLIWAFVGGFILIFGARMAGGCTSGHILSGGMQMAVSSLVFGLFVVVGLIVTGKIFYKK
ncbi:MAG: YeeE/YedE family protein [Calditrichaeota bacterium]|nr:YeeE/YedE family protein [Calditrichota bacterium]